MPCFILTSVSSLEIHFQNWGCLLIRVVSLSFSWQIWLSGFTTYIMNPASKAYVTTAQSMSNNWHQESLQDMSVQQDTTPPSMNAQSVKTLALLWGQTCEKLPMKWQLTSEFQVGFPSLWLKAYNDPSIERASGRMDSCIPGDLYWPNLSVPYLGSDLRVLLESSWWARFYSSTHLKRKVYSRRMKINLQSPCFEKRLRVLNIPSWKTCKMQ